jgi:hypothetical protein
MAWSLSSRPRLARRLTASLFLNRDNACASNFGQPSITRTKPRTGAPSWAELENWAAMQPRRGPCMSDRSLAACQSGPVLLEVGWLIWSSSRQFVFNRTSPDFSY